MRPDEPANTLFGSGRKAITRGVVNTAAKAGRKKCMTSVSITNLRNPISANDGHQADRELYLNRAGGSCYTTGYGA